MELLEGRGREKKDLAWTDKVKTLGNKTVTAVLSDFKKRKDFGVLEFPDIF